VKKNTESGGLPGSWRHIKDSESFEDTLKNQKRIGKRYGRPGKGGIQAISPKQERGEQLLADSWGQEEASALLKEGRRQYRVAKSAGQQRGENVAGQKQ